MGPLFKNNPVFQNVSIWNLLNFSLAASGHHIQTDTSRSKPQTLQKLRNPEETHQVHRFQKEKY